MAAGRAVCPCNSTRTEKPVNVPLLDLQLQYASIRDDVLAAIVRVCDSQQFIHGPECLAFESEVASAIGTRHAIGVSSGTDALLAVLMALGVKGGDEVIVPAFSFVATADVVVRLGAVPVFADVEPERLTLDPEAVRLALTSRTRAIIPVHLYGLCADMRAINDVADGAGVPVVEDAAQAVGASIDERQAGTWGIAGCFSFYPTKNLGAFGDGGLVTTDDDELAARVRVLRDHGASTRYHHDVVGGNFRLDALQAAVLRVKLSRLGEWTARRRANADRYGELFAKTNSAAVVSLPTAPSGWMHVFHQYAIRARDRDGLRSHLASKSIGTGVYYRSRSIGSHASMRRVLGLPRARTLIVRRRQCLRFPCTQS